MPKPGEIRYCPDLGGEATNAAFVWIPPGSFWMGDKSRKDNPVHFVVISKGFWLQQTPLTERQYNGQSYKLPQVDISWDDVSNFCQGKPLRMPTEAEWEYAARANTGHKYLLSGSNVEDYIVWNSEKFGGYRPTVGSVKPNNIGLFDVSGNVFEWCHDWYEPTESSAPQLNPTGPVSGSFPALRGGSWGGPPLKAQVAFRDYTGPDSRSGICGVRLIWEPQHA